MKNLCLTTATAAMLAASACAVFAQADEIKPPAAPEGPVRVEKPVFEEADDAPLAVKRTIKDVEKLAKRAAEWAQLGAEKFENATADMNLDLFLGEGGRILGPFGPNFGGRAATKPLVIHGPGMEPAQSVRLQEDLTVMERILNKAAARSDGHGEDHKLAMGIIVSGAGNTRRPQSLYLEGHGAVFMLNVRFPLAASPTKPAAAKVEAEDEDSEWEETREELFGNHPPRRGEPMVYFSGPKGPNESPVEFDAELVSELRKSLVESLKNAANIRGLKPEEWITVAVLGPSDAGQPQVRRSLRRSPNPVGDPVRVERNVIVRTAKASGPEGTQLTLRVKKADADAFAKGVMKRDEFEKKVTVAAY